MFYSNRVGPIQFCRCTGESELPVCVNVSVGGCKERSVITDNELLWLDQYLELVQQNLDSHLSWSYDMNYQRPCEETSRKRYSSVLGQALFFFIANSF